MKTLLVDESKRAVGHELPQVHSSGEVVRILCWSAFRSHPDCGLEVLGQNLGTPFDVSWPPLRAIVAEVSTPDRGLVCYDHDLSTIEYQTLEWCKTFLRAGAYNVVHIEVGELTAIQLAAYFLEIPIVLSVAEHFGIPPMAALQMATWIICPSEASKLLVLQQNIPPEKVLFHSSLKECPSQQDRASSVGADVSIALVAPMRADYGHKLFLRAMSALQTTMPDVRALIVDESLQSNSPYRFELEVQIERECLKSSIFFRSGANARSDALAHCRVVAFCNADYPASNLVRQAVANGNVVVGPEASWFSQMVVGRADAFTYKRDSSADLTRKLVEALALPKTSDIPAPLQEIASSENIVEIYLHANRQHSACA